MIRILPLLCLFIALSPYDLPSQNIDRSVIASSAYLGPQGEWVFGETINSDFILEDRQLNNGFLQGDLIITGIEQPTKINFDFVVFPNPFRHEINIRHTSVLPVNIAIRDLTGTIVYKKNQIGSEDWIAVKQLPSGIYLLSYHTEHSEIGHYQIIKIQ